MLAFNKSIALCLVKLQKRCFLQAFSNEQSFTTDKYYKHSIKLNAENHEKHPMLTYQKSYSSRHG